MKIWHISDTHTWHDMLTVPVDIDVVVFSGDCSNPRNPYENEPEVRDFLKWFSGLEIPHKIMIAGNHDSSIERGLVDKKTIEALGIHYLFNSSVTISGVNFWGSPYTPTFGQWSFNMSRAKLDRVWQTIPENTDVVIIHGPPQGILDLARDREGDLEMCGCSALTKSMARIQPKAMLFGHIHNSRCGILNQGILKRYDTIFSNASCVTDGKFGRLSSNGNKITIK